MLTLLVILISYLIGSIPFAYILIKIYAKQDIRTIGSGNVGAMNSYETTGKKWIGIAVFFLDMFKGLIAVLLAYILTDNDFLSVVFAALIAVVGHNYSIFLKFKGGRGLATAVGSAVLTLPIAVIIWGLFWLLGKAILKLDLFISNSIALIGTPFAFFFLPEKWILSTSLLNTSNILYFKLSVSVLCLIILLAHIEPLKQIFNKTNDE